MQSLLYIQIVFLSVLPFLSRGLFFSFLCSVSLTFLLLSVFGLFPNAVYPQDLHSKEELEEPTLEKAANISTDTETR